MGDSTGQSNSSHDPIHETVAEALAAWDRGETVFTVEMGGIGPGYEQCIQILAFELMREWNGRFPPVGEPMSDGDRQKLNDSADAVVHLLNAQYGFSGAQVGAAKNLASLVCRRGYRAALRMPEVKDRLIQVSRNMPEAPKVGGVA